MTTCSKLIMTLVAVAFTAGTALSQKAITISRVVNNDDKITSDEINRIKDAVTVSDTLDGWVVDWVGALKGAQAAYSNWSNGGINTVSATGSSIFNAKYREGLFAYVLSTDLRYGLSYIGGEGTRKINDKIAINNKFSYRFGQDSLWSAFANVNFTTQFAPGYNFSGKQKELISEFMAPAYFTQIAGIGYLPTPSLSFTAGLALKETFVLTESLTKEYLSAGVNFRIEPGFSMGIQYEKEILKNVKILTSLETFTNIKRPLERTDVFFNAELIGSVNNFISVSFQFVAIYDDDFSEQLQIKQVLAAGVSFTLM